MDVIIIGILAVLTGIYAFFTKERSIENQQRFYEIIFGRRLKIANITAYLIFTIIIEMFGLFMIIVGVKRLL